MKTELKKYSIRDVTNALVFNEYEGKGLYGLVGELVIKPVFQSN